jgi:hypothetical protein
MLLRPVAGGEQHGAAVRSDDSLLLFDGQGPPKLRLALFGLGVKVFGKLPDDVVLLRLGQESAHRVEITVDQVHDGVSFKECGRARRSVPAIRA